MRLKVTFGDKKFVYAVKDPQVTVTELARSISARLSVATSDLDDVILSLAEFVLLPGDKVSDVLSNDDCLTLSVIVKPDCCSSQAKELSKVEQRWLPADRCPETDDLVCYRPKELNYLTGEEFFATEYKVAQVLWVDTKLKGVPIIALREFDGPSGEGAFDTLELSDLTDLHIATKTPSEPQAKRKRSNAETKELKLKHAIRRQIEWYLSPLNLERDRFLVDKICENSGKIPTSLFLTFPRISDITDDLEIVSLALSLSRNLHIEQGVIILSAEELLKVKKIQLLGMIT